MHIFYFIRQLLKIFDVYHKEGRRVDQWEAGIWSCDLRTNERPRKKLHGKGTDRQTDTHTHRRTCQLLDQLGPEGRVGEKHIKSHHKTEKMEIRLIEHLYYTLAVSESKNEMQLIEKESNNNNKSKSNLKDLWL